jgi:hypothetical protein
MEVPILSLKNVIYVPVPKSIKGQFQKKVGELKVWSVSLGPNLELIRFFFNFSDQPFNSCEFLNFAFHCRNLGIRGANP